ncbi:hypothetical protein KI387_038651, partial [Taxus chinensis]
AEGGRESTSSTARFSGCYSGEGPSPGSGAVTTGAACCRTGTDWGVTGAVSQAQAQAQAQVQPQVPVQAPMAAPPPPQ